MKVLFVDNFDSFTYNLVEYVSQHPDAETEVVKNTASVADVRERDPDAVVVSPGPGHPANERDVGVSTAVFREVAPEVPALGVCLGLEAAVYAYGGSVGRAPEPVHGKTTSVEHDGKGVFAGLDQGFPAGRYHSLVATEVPDCFEVSATATVGGLVSEANEASSNERSEFDGGERSPGSRASVDERSESTGGEPSGARRTSSGEQREPDSGTELVMGVRHRDHPIECVQFHPESVLTGAGHDVVDNFLTGVRERSHPPA